jgi:EmrB/QacA subfamily drug resistance transporter
MAIAVVPRSIATVPCADRGGGGEVCGQAARKWVLIATILGSSLAFMDGSVVNVALPALQARFQATSGGIQWVVQSYALMSAALLLLGGAIGDRYGRRRTYLWGVGIFAVASAACAASASLGELVAARAVQGVGAALLIPQGLSILSAAFPAEERGRAIGTWSAWTSVCAALGPVAGGWLIEAWSWRLIFLLNLPVALVVFALARHIPESKAEGSGAKSLDRLGATLVTLSLVAMIYALSFAPQLGWRSPKVVWPLIAGVALMIAFLRSQVGRSNAMMPLSLFRIPRFLAANLLTFLLYGALSGALYVIPFYSIQVRHYPPAVAGAVFLPLIALIFVFSARVGALIPRVGERVLLTAGTVCAGLGFAAFALLDGHAGYVSALLPGVLLLGAGMALVVAPLTNAVMSSVPAEDTGVASAVNNALSRLAGLIAVSLLTLVLVHGFTSSLGTQLSASSLPDDARREMTANQARLRETPIPGGLSVTQKSEVAGILDRAFLNGFRLVMLSSAAAAWLGALTVVVLLRKPKEGPA